jgi:hypothetical protein
MGIASALNREVLGTLRKMRPRRVRFCTAASNRATRAIATKFGFEAICRFRYYWQKTRKGRPRGEAARERQVATIYEYVCSSPFFRLSSGLLGEGWIFRELTRGILMRYVRKGRVWTALRRGALTGVAIYTDEKADGNITLGFVHGDGPALRMLARNCIYMAADRGDEYCSAAVPTRYYARVLEGAGYDRKESIGQAVFEYAVHRL